MGRAPRTSHWALSRMDADTLASKTAGDGLHSVSLSAPPQSLAERRYQGLAAATRRNLRTGRTGTAPAARRAWRRPLLERAPAVCKRARRT